MRYYCNICKKTITHGEYDYSINHYGRALWRAHQRKDGYEGHQSESADIIDTAMKWIYKAYRIGGIGLAVFVFSACGIFFLMLFKSLTDNHTFIGLFVFFVIIMISGIWICCKQKKNKT
jgi:hypothetical protein